MTAVSPIGPDGKASLAEAPGDRFTFDRSAKAYQFNLSTKGLAPGEYTLLVTIGSDPTLPSPTFLIG